MTQYRYISDESMVYLGVPVTPVKGKVYECWPDATDTDPGGPPDPARWEKIPAGSEVPADQVTGPDNAETAPVGSAADPVVAPPAPVPIPPVIPPNPDPDPAADASDPATPDPADAPVTK